MDQGITVLYNIAPECKERQKCHPILLFWTPSNLCWLWPTRRKQIQSKDGGNAIIELPYKSMGTRFPSGRVVCCKKWGRKVSICASTMCFSKNTVTADRQWNCIHGISLGKLLSFFLDLTYWPILLLLVLLLFLRDWNLVSFFPPSAVNRSINWGNVCAKRRKY